MGFDNRIAPQSGIVGTVRLGTRLSAGLGTGLGIGLGTGLGIGLSLVLAAQPAHAEVTETDVNRVVNALREASKPTKSTPNGLYSDWQVTPDSVSRWSKSCLGREVTPTQFQASESTARSVVTCVVRDAMKQEYKASGNNQAVAVKRVAAWWLTGDPNRYKAPEASAYVQAVAQGFTQDTGATSGTIAAKPAEPTGALPTPLTPAPKLNPIAIKPISAERNSAGTAPRPNSSKPVVPVKPNTKPEAKPETQGAGAGTPVPKPTIAPTPNPKTPRGQQATFYDRYMQAAYAAAMRKDNTTAMLYFKRALDERPQDKFATQAIREVEAEMAAPRQSGTNGQTIAPTPAPSTPKKP